MNADIVPIAPKARASERMQKNCRAIADTPAQLPQHQPPQTEPQTEP
jgi:hypothetical protein